MPDKIIVVGAGMAGLLAGCMLRSDCEYIQESQPSLPNNHSALLRFRSSVVGDTLGIEFKKVNVLKTIAPWRNPMADALSYAKKATGTYALRSSLTAKSELEERFIAPGNLIEMMAERVQSPIKFNKSVDFKSLKGKPVISTIPMPALMKALEYPRADKVDFNYSHGANINAILENCKFYGTVYVPNPEIDFTRISITGDRLTIEFSGMDAVDLTFENNRYMSEALSILGMKIAGKKLLVDVKDIEVSNQKYAKILPIDDDERKRFIVWATDKFNIYSLGRFATWRPSVLLDDVVKDIRLIKNLIRKGHSYDQKKGDV